MLQSEFTVKLQPSGRTFPVAAGQDVLAAASGAGITLRHSCRVGHCRACLGRITSGIFDPGATAGQQLSVEARDNGFALLCQAKPLSDLDIEAHELPFLAGPQTIPAYVKSIERLTDNIAAITLRVPPSASMTFLAGQHVDFILPDGRRRSYSIANPPEIGGSVSLEFHVRHFPGGAFSEHVFSTMKARDRVTIEGPLGSFFLQESEGPLIFLATGTGYAPIRAIMLQALAAGVSRPITLYCGMRFPAELYMLDEARALALAHPNVTFIPVISRPAQDNSWPGRTGHVQDAAVADHGNMIGMHVYACGSPVMIASAERAFLAQGLPAASFFSDAFVNEAVTQAN